MPKNWRWRFSEDNLKEAERNWCTIGTMLSVADRFRGDKFRHEQITYRMSTSLDTGGSISPLFEAIGEEDNTTWPQ
jgi:hypothetical protein